MKILFIRNTGRISGSETYNINLFSKLRKNANLDFVFLTNLSNFATRISKMGVLTKRINWGAEGVGTKKRLAVAVFTLPIVIPRYLYAIFSLEKGKRFDLICLQSMTEKLFLTTVLKVMGYSIIWTELGPIYVNKMTNLVKFLYRLVSKSTDKILTISKNTKLDLVSGGVEKSKIKTIYTGIDPIKFRPFSKNKINNLRTARHIPIRSLVIGFLGTVTYEKGIWEFIETSRELLKKDLKIHFIVIGNGPELRWAQDKVNQLKISDYYSFPGYVEDVRKHLGIIDILLLPTHHFEGLSLALLEAQTMGKVIITSKIGGNSEIVTDDVNGFIFSKFDVKSVVKLINTLNENRSKLSDLGAAARENALEKFNINKQVKKFVKEFITYDHRN